MSGRLLVTICGRAGSKGFKNKNLKTFCGLPLAHYSLAAAELFLESRPGLEADIVLNTDSPELRQVVCGAYPAVIPLERPEALCGDTVPKMAVFQHSLAEMEARGAAYSHHLDLDITSPLRSAEDIARCYEAMAGRSDLDVVMSAVPSRRSPYMNMAQRVGDHVEQVVKTRFTARQQTPPCYDLNASIYVFRRAFLSENSSGFLWDGRCDVVEMMDTGVLDIDSEEDFILMELIAAHLFESNPGLAAVQQRAAATARKDGTAHAQV